MLPNANDLTFFIEVANTGNLSRAAERLGVSQPALSQAMKRLENSFENQLLLRSKSGVVLTKAGEKLNLEARALLEYWTNLKEESMKDEEQVRGIYRLGIHSSVALYTLPAFCAEVLQQFPNLELRLQHDLSRKITEGIISFKLDFGIVVNPVEHPDLIIKELFKDEVAFYSSKKISEKNRSVLISEPDLLQTQELLSKVKAKNKEFLRTVTSSNLEVIKSMVLSGTGVGILPGRVVGNDANKVEVLPGFPKFKDRICLVFRHDLQKSRAA
ncbi:MAG: LysR family transcriptional regulator, partial [Halobacteriovoraceae bacterium]|nr:LysR family transcriptional regulator [Halobacteriovoraceae bacterium]